MSTCWRRIGGLSSWLRCPDGPPELRETLGYRLTELNRIAERLTDALAELCGEWERIHGDH